MSLTIDNILIVGSLLLLISIIAGKTSFKFGVPTLILFLVIGMLAGSEGPGGIYFDDPRIAQFIGIVSLNFILFSGGLVTDWNSIKPVLVPGITLSILGVFLTAVSLGIFVWAITDFTIFEGLLLGAIVSSTDAAAVFSMLRSKSLALKKELRPTLELESGSNDPMAYVLTITFLGIVINKQWSLSSILGSFLGQMLIGIFLGFLFGYLARMIINKIRLDYEGLTPILVISIMFLTFSITDFLRGNGFLAVYLSAVYLGNQELIHKKTILKMFDGFAWLMQIILFLTLGLLVFPSQVYPVAGIGLIISLFLIFVARPLSIFISLFFTKIGARKQVYIAWVGLRGAVPIVFATYPLIANIDKAEMIFNIVFFISLTSVIIQGTSLPIVAKWLGVSLPQTAKPPTTADLLMSERTKTNMAEIQISHGDYAAGKRIIELSFPITSIIAMIKRGEKFITPHGSTEIHAGDILIVLAEDKESLDTVYESLRIDGPR